MQSCQKLFFTAPYHVKILEAARPQPEKGEVLVQTLVSAISAGTELLFYRGQVPSGTAVDTTIPALSAATTYPLQYGYAAVGRIISLGTAVDANWLGKLVFAFQPHASHFVAQPNELIVLPKEMDADTAVFLPNMETAVSFLMDAQPMIGERVAVFGQGIIGLLTTALLSKLPFSSLITLDRIALRREWSRKLGADVVFNPAEAGVVELVRHYKGGNQIFPGTDLTFELSGNPAALEQAINVTGFSGRVLVGSWYGDKRAVIDLGDHFHRNHITLISSQVSQIAPQWNGRFSKKRRLNVALDMLASTHPEQLITQRLPLSQAVTAYQQLDQEPENHLQIIFNYEN